MKANNFKRSTKTRNDFVSGGVEIEDTHLQSAPKGRAEEPEASAQIEEKMSARAQIYVTEAQYEWLREKAYEGRTKMTVLIRDLINAAMVQSSATQKRGKKGKAVKRGERVIAQDGEAKCRVQLYLTPTQDEWIRAQVYQRRTKLTVLIRDMMRPKYAPLVSGIVGTPTSFACR